MAFDAHSNFGYSNVAVAPAPENSGTSLQVAAGQGALFPAAPFNCTVWPAGVNPLSANAEIVRVTAIVGDTFTIDRAQEGTAAINIGVGFQIANTTSRKVFTDIEAACVIGAGTQTVTGPFVFLDGNGITFGMDNGTITGSVAPSAGGSINFSAGTTSNNLASITFADSNGISFGLDNGTLTARHNGITLQSTQPVAASASNGSFLFSTLGFSNTNGISFGTSAGGFIFASHNGLTSQSNQAASASNGSFTFQTLSFTNAFNVTFGTSAGGIIFASVATAAAGNSVNFSAGTQSSNLGSIVFANSNGIEFGLSNGTITARDTLALTSQSNQAASASNGSFAFQTINFTNANNVTFGTSAGSIIFASVAPPGGGATVSEFYPQGKILLQAGAPDATQFSIQFMQVPYAVTFTECAVAFNQSVTLAANNSLGGLNYSITMVLFTGSNGQLDSIGSTTYQTGVTISSNGSSSLVAGAFFLPVPFASSMSPGSYWFGVRMNTANTGGVITGANTTALSWNMSMFGLNTAVQSQIAMRNIGQITANSAGWFTCEGYYATTNLTQIQQANMSQINSGPRVNLALRFKA